MHSRLTMKRRCMAHIWGSAGRGCGLGVRGIDVVLQITLGGQEDATEHTLELLLLDNVTLRVHLGKF